MEGISLATSGEPVGRDIGRDVAGVPPATLGVIWVSGRCGYFVRNQKCQEGLEIKLQGEN
jgi:hypothetical protein